MIVEDHLVTFIALATTPEFIYPIDNITVAAGREAHFTCVVNNLEGHKVAWLRSDSKAILVLAVCLGGGDHGLGGGGEGHHVRAALALRGGRREGGRQHEQVVIQSRGDQEDRNVS